MDANVTGRAALGHILELMPVWALIASVAVTLVSGFVKGAVGFAMPLIMISGMGAFLPPELALAGIILPVVVSNLLQTFRQGAAVALSAIREFWRYLVVVCVAIFATAQFVTLIAPWAFFLILGVPVVLLTAIQLAGVTFRVAPHRRAAAEWIIGTISGILGGLAGTWGPTTVLYLIAIDTPKQRQMVVQGVIYGLGSITLLVAHLRSGILDAQTAPFSAAMLAPALAGMWLGFRLQDRLDRDQFKKLTLVVLIVAGLNLIRRGLAAG